MLLVGEYDQAGNLIQELVWLGDIPVATIRTDQSGGSVGVFYIHTDHLNAPAKITRPSDNAIIWRWDHDPYGNGAPNQDPDGNGLALNFNLRFPGQYYDQETNFYYNWNRYYDQSTGRYISSDPIGLDGGSFSTYAYVGNNPISSVDATGLFYTSVDWACMHDPQFCAEIMGQIVDNAATMSGDACLSEAAESLKNAFNSISNIIAVIEMVPGIEKAIVKSAPKPTFPKSAKEMDDFLGFPGQRIPDKPNTPGRDKVVWQPNSSTKITYEQHPYHPGAPDYHAGPHYHVDTPGNPHKRYLPGEPIPGY